VFGISIIIPLIPIVKMRCCNKYLQPYFNIISIAKKVRGIACANFTYNVNVYFIKEEFNTGNNNMFKFKPAILGGVAKVERELTVERIRGGKAKAKRYGTRSGRPVGRPRRKIPAGFKKYYPLWEAGEVTATAFARLVGVSRPTLYQYI